jgi:hypothetical protein
MRRVVSVVYYKNEKATHKRGAKGDCLNAPAYRYGFRRKGSIGCTI